MMEERQMALPKLYGAPAYRPPKRVLETPRPFDPDEMPISAYRTDDEAEFIESLPEEAFVPGGGVVLGQAQEPTDGEQDQPRKRGLGRLFGRN